MDVGIGCMRVGAGTATFYAGELMNEYYWQ